MYVVPYFFVFFSFDQLEKIISRSYFASVDRLERVFTMEMKYVWNVWSINYGQLFVRNFTKQVSIYGTKCIIEDSEILCGRRLIFVFEIVINVEINVLFTSSKIAILIGVNQTENNDNWKCNNWFTRHEELKYYAL